MTDETIRTPIIRAVKPCAATREAILSTGATLPLGETLKALYAPSLKPGERFEITGVAKAGRETIYVVKDRTGQEWVLRDSPKLSGELTKECWRRNVELPVGFVLRWTRRLKGGQGLLVSEWAIEPTR